MTLKLRRCTKSIRIYTFIDILQWWNHIISQIRQTSCFLTKFAPLRQELRPEIVIVEEAAEVLEAQRPESESVPKCVAKGSRLTVGGWG